MANLFLNYQVLIIARHGWHQFAHGTKNLQSFADLFPPEYILDDAFFQKVPDQEVWKHLNDLGIVRTDVIISGETANLKTLSLELHGVKEDHETTCPRQCN